MDLSTTPTLAARAALHAHSRPDQPAVICEDRTLTYAQLHRESNRTAHALLAAGLGPGSRIGYLGQESEHYYDLALGCAKSGAVLVPINWRLTPTEVEHVLRDSQAELLFVEREFRPTVDKVSHALPQLRQLVDLDSDTHVAGGLLAWKQGLPDTDLPPATGFDDPVAQLYTSGTTGLPKGVVLAQRTFFTLIADTRRAGVDWIDWRTTDRGLSCFPGLHTAGFGWFMHSFNAGATTVIMRRFIADEAARLIERHAITTLWAAPAMLRMMLAEHATTKDTFRTLRKVVYSGSPIDRELLLTCIDILGCELAQGYSSAEAGSFLTCLAPQDHTPGSTVLASAGRALPGNEIRILDDRGNVLPPAAPAASPPAPRPGSWATGSCPTPPHRPSPATGSPWATWDTSTRTATSTWSTGSTTPSSSRARTSTPPRWRTRQGAPGHRGRGGVRGPRPGLGRGGQGRGGAAVRRDGRAPGLPAVPERPHRRLQGPHRIRDGHRTAP